MREYERLYRQELSSIRSNHDSVTDAVELQAHFIAIMCDELAAIRKTLQNGKDDGK